MTTTVKPQKTFTDSFAFDSSVLESGYYNKNTLDLFLSLHNGATVGYKSVQVQTWDSLINAVSPGGYWNRNIKPYYEGQDAGVGLQYQSPYDDDPKPEYTEARVSSKETPVKYSVKVNVNGVLEFSGETTDPSKTKESLEGSLSKMITSGTFKITEVRHLFDN